MPTTKHAIARTGPCRARGEHLTAANDLTAEQVDLEAQALGAQPEPARFSEEWFAQADLALARVKQSGALEREREERSLREQMKHTDVHGWVR